LVLEEPDDPRLLLLLPRLPLLELLPRLPLLPLETVPFEVLVLFPELLDILPEDEVEAPLLWLELLPIFLRSGL
jgi:hypothetical protein